MTDEVRFDCHAHGKPRRVLDAEGIVYLVAVIAFLGAYLFLVFFPEAIEYQCIGSLRHAGAGSSGRASGPALPEATQFLERRLADARDLRISFNMRVTDSGAHDNLFQTAPRNDGVRMELGQPSVLALVVGSREPAGLSGFIVSRNVERGRWHSVRLSISRDKQIRAFFDGKLAVDVKDPKLDYTISDIAFGTGFSKTRPFGGDLSNVSMTYRLYRKNWLLYEAILPLKLFLLVLLTLVAARFICRVSAVVAPSGFSPVQKASLAGSIVVAGFALAVAYHYVNGAYLGLGYPYDTFLFRPQDRFNDFFNLYGQITGTETARGWPFLPAPPLGFFFLYPFTLLSPELGLALFLSLIVAWLFYFAVKSLPVSDTGRAQSVLALALLTYPVLFLLDRANSEGIAFIFLCLSILAMQKKKYLTASICLGVATYVKVYPLVFLVLFIAERRYREAFISVLVTAAFVALGFLAYRGSFLHNAANLATNLDVYNRIATLGWAGLPFGHSLFGLLKVLLGFGDTASHQTADIVALTRVYFPVVTAAFLALSAYVVLVERAPWKRVALLVFSMNLFPYVSADYKLIYALIPLFLFLNAEQHDGDDLFFAILFGVLLVPKAYHHPWSNEVSISVLINPLIMLSGMALIVLRGLTVRRRVSLSRDGNSGVVARTQRALP